MKHFRVTLVLALVIGARERLSRTFTIALSEIPVGFAGVRDVRLENGKVVVETRK